MRILTEKDYIVLSKVFDKNEDKGFSQIKASTVYEIEDRIKKTKHQISTAKIRDALKILLEYGYVEKGIRKVRKDTFLITAKGMNNLQTIKLKSVNIKRKGDN